MSRPTLCVILVFCLSGGILSLPAQDMAGETRSEIPELTAFHEIIFPIWHEAYPAKDAKALRGYVPRVNELAAGIYAVKLSGILQEKEAKWNAGLAEFRKSVEAYNTAAKGTDNQALLAAAEAMHAKYEALVRAINPVLKEMDVFHQALYVIYHSYLPEKAYDKIRGATADLVIKAQAITAATLPKQFAAKADSFKVAAAELLDAAKALDAAGNAHDHPGMEAGVERVHARYEALQSLFE